MAVDAAPAAPLSACRALVPYAPPRATAAAVHDLVVTPHPLTLHGQTITRAARLRPGESLAGLLARHGVDLRQPGWVVQVGGMEVPAALCPRTRVRPGMLIEAHRVPGKSVLRLVAMVALAYFTLGTGLAAGGLGGYLGLTGFAAYAANVGAFMLGSMVINKVLPPPGAGSYSGAQAGSTYSLQGARNGARHFGPLGLLFGQVRVSPDFAAQPYSWFEGDDQYQYVQLHAGLNVHTVEALQIGETAIESYSGVVITRTGFASGNTPMMSWAESVDTVAGGLLDAPTAPGAYVERTSSVNTVHLQVDVVGQLQYINSKGSPERFACLVDMEYRLLPGGAWLPLVGASATVELANSTTKPLRRTFTRTVAAGQYAVRMRKITKNETRTQAANVIEWAALKSYQADTGTAVARQVVGIRIKASGQLNGTLDQVTWLATSTPCPVWNGSAWVTQTTSNPGALILQFARGVFAPDGRLLWGYGKPDSQIDIDGLKAFMVHCTAQGYRFDHWFTEQMSRRMVLDAIAAAGMASISRHTGKLGVVYMAAGQPIEAVVNMGNIKRGSFRVDYSTRTTAEEVEVASPERTNAFRPASLRVLAPGVTVPRETARVSPAGITTQAGRLLAARSLMAQNIYGRKSVTWEMDLEHLTVRRWSMVALSHDLTQWGYGGRLRGIVQNVVRYSEDLRNTAEAGATRPWFQFDDTAGSVLVTRTTVSPPTNMEAYCKLQAADTGAVQRQVSQSLLGVGDNATVCLEVLAKAGECTHLRLYCSTRAGAFPYVLFNLATGTVQLTNETGGTGIVGTISPTADAGWWRCSIVSNVLVGVQTPSVVMQMQSPTNGVFSAAAVGDGLYLTGVVGALGDSIDAYARTTSASAIGIALDAEVEAAGTPHVGLRLLGEQTYRVFAVLPFTGAAHMLTLTDAWPGGVPLPGTVTGQVHDALWIFDFNAAPGKRLRITDIAPTPDLTGARITAVPEPDEFWTFIATGAYTAPAGTSGARAPVVAELRAWAEVALTTTGDQVQANLTWNVSGDFASALVMGAATGQPLAYIGTSYGNSWYGWNVERGLDYVVEVRPFDALGRPGAPVSISFQAAPIAREPADVIAFTALERESFGRVYYWDYNDFIPDLAGFEARYVDAAIPGAAWEQMAPLFEAGRNDRSASVNLPADGNWIIAIKAVDVAGNASLAERRAMVSFDHGGLGAPVLSVDCGPGGWPGTLTNCGVRDYYLIDKGVLTWATVPSTWAGWATWQGAAYGSITYQHSTLDLGSAAARRIRTGHVAAGSVATEYQSSTDGVTYTAWAAVPSGAVTFRYIRVRWTVTGTWPVLYRAQFRIYL